MSGLSFRWGLKAFKCFALVPMMLITQENNVARLHFKQECKQNRNRLINVAYCCQVLPGRKLHLSVLKGACRCEPWIENGAVKKNKKKGEMWDVHVVNSQSSASYLSLSLPPFLTHSLALSLSLTYSYTQKNRHSLFRYSHHHTLNLFSFSAASLFSLLRLIKGSTFSGAWRF